MGVPKFFRWLSERYPKTIQRLGRVPEESTVLEHFDEIPASFAQPDPLSECSTPPVIDRLYIDMNGILHGCSHNNNDGETAEDDVEAKTDISEEQIFQNVCYYLDRIVKDIAQPSSLVYMAIDGVAPRAKLNQQRSRRYRSGKEGLIETTIFEAHIRKIAEQEALLGEGEATDARDEEYGGRDADTINTTAKNATTEKKTIDSEKIEEVEPGRFAGKFLVEEASEESCSKSSNEGDTEQTDNLFHSNNITPGTPFFSNCTAAITDFVKRKISTDPAWQGLTVVFSGPNVPGEGEHKIMQFMREQKYAYEWEEQQISAQSGEQMDKINTDDILTLPGGYHPNLRHCIMGQDGDLIMLGLLTHEPNLVLLREQVLFDLKRRNRLTNSMPSNNALATYIHNPNFELLHMSVLRDYFAYEFETANVLKKTKWDLEQCIDDFVFMTFIVGNDFLPHMPAVDIADEAFDLLFYTYREQRKRWALDKTKKPYLVDRGSIVCGDRLQDFFQALGRHESSYLEYKQEMEDQDKNRALEKKYGMSTIPSDAVIAAKEAADRAQFRERITKKMDAYHDEPEPLNLDHYREFQPVLSAPVSMQKREPAVVNEEKYPSKDVSEAEDMHDRMGNLLRVAVDGGKSVEVIEDDLKGRYYSDKFGFSPFDKEKHIALRASYLEGLVWNLKYYFEGCPSWEWYYPYHYGPMLSDMVGVESMLNEISFEEKMGAPLRPFEQLMACMPPSFASVLPEPYRPLMTQTDSAIADFYPQSFSIDMNGKRWPWEAVVLLPFIDSKRLLEASSSVDGGKLTDDEQKRNEFGAVSVFSHDKEWGIVQSSGEGPLVAQTNEVPFDSTDLVYKNPNKPVFTPKLHRKVELPLPGMATLRDGSVRGMWRKLLRVNVHGTKSRYKTALLEIENGMPALLPTPILAEHLIGNMVWINYPHFIEAFVTAVSDSQGIYRGKQEGRSWNAAESQRRILRTKRISNSYVFGEKLVGSGGLSLLGGEEAMGELNTFLSVRPFRGLKTLPDGTTVKTFAKFEIEVPLFVTGWAPEKMNERIANFPVRLEKDPYDAAEFVITEEGSFKPPPNHLSTNGGSSISSAHSNTLPPFSDKPILAKGYHTVTVPTQRNSIRSSLPIALRQRQFRVRSALRRDMSTGLSSRLHPLISRGVMKSRSRCLMLGLLGAVSYFSGVQGSLFESSRSSLPKMPVLFKGRGDRASLSSVNESPSYFTKKTAPPLEFAHGTTTLAFAFQGGIIAAVDSRASMGSFVGSKTTQKVIPISSHVLGTMAGGAADCTYWIRKLRCEAALYELNESRRMSVAQASRILSNWMYENRGRSLSVGTMIMGFDEIANSSGSTLLPKIFYIDNTGVRLEGLLFSVGSGSTLALGVLDSELRYDMATSEAVELGIKAIRYATFRDAYSGGFINVYLLTARDGWKRVFTEDLDQMAPTAIPESK